MPWARSCVYLYLYTRHTLSSSLPLTLILFSPTEYPQSIHRVSTEYPQSIHRVSTEYPQSIHRVSTEYPQSIHRVSTDYPQSIHRVSTEWRWPLSGVHSIMMVKSSQPGEGGRCTPSLFHSIYHHEQSFGVRSNWEGRYSTPISPIFLSIEQRRGHCDACLVVLESSQNYQEGPLCTWAKRRWKGVWERGSVYFVTTGLQRHSVQAKVLKYLYITHPQRK